MPKIAYLLFPVLFWGSMQQSVAQQSCCEIKKNAGQTAYNKGDYALAIKKWEEYKNCSDASCADFNALIAKAQQKQAAANRAAELRKQQEREAEAARIEREKQAAANRAADDAFWDALKDGDIAACNKYLARYPAGRHAGDADRRKKLLAVPPDSQVPIEKLKDAEKIPDNMVRVRGGTFTMGDMFAEGSGDELPTHSVTVGDFLLGKTEVTFNEFDAFCNATGREKPGDADWGRGSRPVIFVDWYDAIEYCNWLSQQQGLQVVYTIEKYRKDPNNSNSSDTKKWVVTPNWNANGYRLPTEAEWEYAAREGGKKLRFGNGKDVADPAQLNFDGSASYKKDYSVEGEYRKKTVPAGELFGAANNLGLRHISGNVWEWCWDWYDRDYYKSSPSKNPSGAEKGSSRVVRGGSWFYNPFFCRAASRLNCQPFLQGGNVGFRVVRHL